MPNQNKPTPPLDEIAPHILRLWKARQTDQQIVQELQKHIDTNRYGIGLTTLLKIRKTMGLQRTRKQGHMVETIRDVMLALRATYLNAGAHEMAITEIHLARYDKA
ncbi:hypothetical protein EV424DRAFT_1353768 [Suillus variegatus]|nr:hypothetical protein EV424DRAFT_1353768 [Suillus variegatus]